MGWNLLRSKRLWCRDNDIYWLTRVKGDSMYLKSNAIPWVRGRHEIRIKHVDENGDCQTEFK